MDSRRLRILLVDDDNDDYVMARDLISEINEWRTDLTWVSTYHDAIVAMENERFDVYLVDYQLGEANGLDLIRQMVRNGCAEPVILLTGQGDREIDIEAMKAGAADYLDKGNLGSVLLERSIRNAIERFRLQSQLKASEERLKTIISQNVDGLIIMDRYRAVHFINPAAEKLLGRGMNCLNGQTFDIPQATEEPQELVFVREDGNSIVAEMRVAAIEWQGEDVYLASIRDITERKKTEELVHQLTQQLMIAQEIEREKLARDLHDSVAQQLSALKIGIDTLFDSCGNILPELQQKVNRCSSILFNLVSEIRNLAYDLRPVNLEYLGLGQSIFEYSKEFTAITGIQVDFMSAGLEDAALDSDIEINLYRIMQEALTNVQKHANASAVKIRLTMSYPNIIFRIEDNGKGFNVKKRLRSAIDQKCMGLWNMQERVKLLNGHMKINSRPKQGVHISIEVSVQKARCSKL
ncbi:MAG: response regulator [Desulfobacterales bacterium]|nr:response regulator [Desulfobacterales bacterium]MDD4073766.1 response regulator [Desulfobacterales bacterium]MDD4402525.1 response regulator [Desulfitobacteriaceae bacterium]